MNFLIILALLLVPNQTAATTTHEEIKTEVKEERILTVEEKIVSVFPEESEIAKKVAKEESSLNQTAYNPEWHYDRNGQKVCQGSYGIMQIACVNYKGDSKDLYDIDLNLKIARQLYEERGWKPWGVCTSGKVKCNQD